MGRVLAQPLLCRLEHPFLVLAHQHYVQHAVVRDQDVGCVLLHRESVPHLSGIRIHTGHMIQEIRVVAILRGPNGGTPSALKRSPLFTKFRGYFLLLSAQGRASGISSEIESVSTTMSVKPVSSSRMIGFLAVERLPQTNHLVLGQGVERIKDHRPNSPGTLFFPGGRLFHQV